MNTVLGHTYRDGEIIVNEGEVGSCMYAIQRGRVQVWKKGREGELPVGELGTGEIFGEMAVFEQEVRSATVRALGEAVVMTVDRRSFLRRIQDDPSIAFQLVRMMSARIRRLSSEVAQLKREAGFPESRL
ncbi:MAG: cyclic nucleotide-binding domain-containing protein [Burkholderiales bacterium]|nr:cyclic nucleotide-binding domain-containing protein [Burkholderiales bacterium]